MLRDNLLKTYSSIEEKYKIAEGKLENSRQAFENAQKDAYYKKQASQQEERTRLDEERTKNRNRVMEAYSSWLHESDDRLLRLQKSENNCENALKDLQHWHPKADELKIVKDQFSSLR